MAAPSQLYIRNEMGQTLGPIAPSKVIIAQLVEQGVLKGKLEVSVDGVNYAAPVDMPEVKEFFPQALWGVAKPLPEPPKPAPAPAPATVPMAGPGARKIAEPGTRTSNVTTPLRAEKLEPKKTVPVKAAPPPPPPPPAAPPSDYTPPPPITAPAPIAVPPIADAGDLGKVGAFRLLAQAAGSNVTGVFHFYIPDRTLGIYFRKGSAEGVTSSNSEDALGKYLVDHHVVTMDQLVQAETAAPQFGGDLIGALMGLALVNPSTLFGPLAQHAQMIMQFAVLAASGAFVFRAEELPSSKALPLGSRWGVLGEVLRKVPISDLKRRLADVFALPLVKSHGWVNLQELSFTPHEARAVGYFDGVHSLAQLVATFPVEADHIIRVAYLLREVDAISFVALRPGRAMPAPEPAAMPAMAPVPAPVTAAVPSPAPPKRPAVAAVPSVKSATPAPAWAAAAAKKARIAKAAEPKPISFEQEIANLRGRAAKLKGESHFEILGLTPSADSQAVKFAYFRLAKVYHPDTVPPDAPPETTKLKEAIFSSVSEAYRVLGEDVSRAQYIEDLKYGGTEKVDVAKLLAAEELFNRAVILVKNRRFADALKILDEAIGHNPDEGEFYAWRGYAKYFASAEKSPERAKALDDLRLALARNDRCAPAHYFIGHIAKLQGDAATALKHFKRTVELAPNHVDARRELRLLAKP